MLRASSKLYIYIYIHPRNECSPLCHYIHAATFNLGHITRRASNTRLVIGSHSLGTDWNPFTWFAIACLQWIAPCGWILRLPVKLVMKDDDKRNEDVRNSVFAPKNPRQTTVWFCLLVSADSSLFFSLFIWFFFSPLSLIPSSNGQRAREQWQLLCRKIDKILLSYIRAYRAAYTHLFFR